MYTKRIVDPMDPNRIVAMVYCGGPSSFYIPLILITKYW